MSFIESHGMQIKKEDYKLVYVGELLGNTSLDDIFERFNIDRPKDFRGHSLSVSDIVVLNDGEKVTAHFVDSISFEQLDSFLNLEERVLSELAYEVGERYFAIQRTEKQASLSAIALLAYSIFSLSPFDFGYEKRRSFIERL